MAELARRTLVTLREFVDRVDNFVNPEDTLKALTDPRLPKVELADKRPKDGRSGKGCQKEVKTRKNHYMRRKDGNALSRCQSSMTAH